MGNLPLHAGLVHVPLGVAFVLPLVAAGVAAAIWRGALPRRAWAIVVALEVVLLGSGVAALRTGESDEDRVERITGERPIEEHEEAAEAFVWAAGAALVLGAIGLGVPEGKAVKIATALTVVATLAVAGLGFRAGHEGGKLVYAHGAAAAYAAPGATASAALHAGEDDD